jgi:hypothetical protein
MMKNKAEEAAVRLQCVADAFDLWYKALTSTTDGIIPIYVYRTKFLQQLEEFEMVILG